jgi:hypothetical protein
VPLAVESFVAVAEFPEQAAAVVAFVALVALVAFVAFVALVAFVAVAALPEMLMPQVPEAPVPVGLGISVPIAKPRFVLAADVVVALVPPLAIGTCAFSADGATPPDESRLFAKFAKFTAWVIFSPVLVDISDHQSELAFQGTYPE